MEKRVKESQSCSTNPSGSGPLSASDKANLIPAEADESELDEPSIADDILSLFGGNDYDEIDTTDNEIDLLDLINESLNPSDMTGPPVSEKLAKLVNEKFTLEFDLAKRKEISQQYNVPTNCDNLYVPRVNTEIWGRLSSNAKKTDIKFSLLQDMLLRISSAVMLTVASLLESRETKTFQIIRGLCHG